MPTAVYAPPAKAIIHFARALGAARSGDLATAQVDIDKLSELKAALEGTNQPYWVGQVEVQILAAQAWFARLRRQGGGGKIDAGCCQPGRWQRKARRDGEPTVSNARVARRPPDGTRAGGCSA